MRQYQNIRAGVSRSVTKSLALVSLTLVALISVSCENRDTGARTFTLTKCVLNAAPTEPFTEVDADGDGATMQPLEIDIYRNDQSLGRWKSVATFFTVKDGRVMRLVVTPLAEAVPMRKCVESIEQIGDFLPKHESEKAKEWMQSIRPEEHKRADAGDKVTNRFVLNDGTEIFVECVAIGRKDEWYSVVRFYADDLSAKAKQ